jgi:hypothetical protein
MHNGVININNVNYDCVYNYNRQLTIFSEVSIDCEINLLKNPEYKKIFVSLYENKSKLYIDTDEFIVEEAYIKAIRMNFNPFNLSMSIMISGVQFRIKDKKDIRKDKIENLLKDDTSI